MVSFRATWDAVVQHLQDNAAELGLAADNIKKGTPFIKMPRQPPYVYVYCLPGEHEATVNGTPNYGVLDISIFCAASPQQAADESLIKAVELAGKIIKVMGSLDLSRMTDGIGIEGEANSSQTTAVLLYRGEYDYV